MNESLIENIKFLSDRLDLYSQPALEARTGVPQTTISGLIKQGKVPRLSTLEKLAKGLDVELWQLLAPPQLLKASLNDGFMSLVSDYCRSPLDGQGTIQAVAQAQAALAEFGSR